MLTKLPITVDNIQFLLRMLCEFLNKHMLNFVCHIARAYERWVGSTLVRGPESQVGAREALKGPIALVIDVFVFGIVNYF